MKITHKTNDHAINSLTVAELKEAIAASPAHATKIHGKKQDLVQRAISIRDMLARAHAEEERIKAEQHEVELINEATNEVLVNIRWDAMKGMTRGLEKARELYDDKLAEMKACDNIAQWVKWNQESSMRAEAWWVALRPLAAFAKEQCDNPTLTMDEYVAQLKEWFTDETSRILDCDPDSMGMDNGAVSLANFHAKQKLCRLLRQFIKYIQKERIEYTGVLQHCGSYCI